MKNTIDTYSKWEELEEFASLMAIDDHPYVKRRVFELKCQELFDLIDQDVPIQTPEPMDAEDLFHWIDWSEAAPSVNIDHNTAQQANQDRFVDDQQPGPSKPTFCRPWLDQDIDQQTKKEIPVDDQQPGPSAPKFCRPWIELEGRGIQENDTKSSPYTFRKKRERVFAKNKATEQTFQVKFNDEWKGDKLKNINDQLHRMFDDVLDKVRGDANDLGRIVVHHGGLDNPIVVPLQPWENLDSDVVMDGISKVLNNNEELVVDDSLEVDVGSISVPSGSEGSNLPITSLFGPGCSLDKKKSIFEIESGDDHLCLPKAIGVCFLKTCKKVNATEWKELVGNDRRSMMELSSRYKTCPKHYYDNMLKKSHRQKMQMDMAIDLCKMTNVPTDRQLGLNDIAPFERLLDVNVLVVSSKLGNKFIRVVDNPDVHNLFIYLVEFDDVKHFHGISSIAGFFGGNYFCETCLKPYYHKESHSCESACDVCTSQDCTTKDPMCCKSCHCECRSME